MTKPVPLYRTVLAALAIDVDDDRLAVPTRDAYEFLIVVHALPEHRDWYEQLRFTDLWRVLDERAYAIRRVADATTDAAPIRFVDERPPSLDTTSYRQFVLYQVLMVATMALEECLHDLPLSDTDRGEPRSGEPRESYWDRSALASDLLEAVLAACQSALHRLWQTQRTDERRKPGALHDPDGLVARYDKLRKLRQMQLRVVCCWCRGLLHLRSSENAEERVRSARNLWATGKDLFVTKLIPLTESEVNEGYTAYLRAVYFSMAIWSDVVLAEQLHDQPKLKHALYTRAIDLGWEKPAHVREVPVPAAGDEAHRGENGLLARANVLDLIAPPPPPAKGTPANGASATIQIPAAWRPVLVPDAFLCATHPPGMQEFLDAKASLAVSGGHSSSSSSPPPLTAPLP